MLKKNTPWNRLFHRETYCIYIVYIFSFKKNSFIEQNFNMYAFRKRSAVNYNDLDNGRLAIVHSSPSPVRLPRRQNICKNERDLLNYLIVDALTKKRQAQMQSISIPICQRVEGQLVEIFGVKRSFCQNEALTFVQRWWVKCDSTKN